MTRPGARTASPPRCWSLHRALIASFEPTVELDGTHQQFHRRRWVNAGSVGMPYEGRTGAFWALVEDGEPDLRRTEYDIDPDAIRATGFPDAEDWLRESFLQPVDPNYVARLFEDRNRDSDCKGASESTQPSAP